jgi:uncharacterized protein YjdB
MHRLWIAGSLVLVQACAMEKVTEVNVASVSITPAGASIVEGDTAVFSAVVADDGGAALDGAQVEWKSDAPKVVAVDANGVARGRQSGVTRIEASFRGITASATVIVLRRR